MQEQFAEQMRHPLQLDISIPERQASLYLPKQSDSTTMSQKDQMRGSSACGLHMQKDNYGCNMIQQKVIINGGDSQSLEQNGRDKTGQCNEDKTLHKVPNVAEDKSKNVEKCGESTTQQKIQRPHGYFMAPNRAVS